MMAGISNTDVAQIDVAREVLGGRLVSVQDQFSPSFRSSWGELEHRTKLGLAFLPRSPLGSIANAKGLAERHSAFQQAADEAGTSVYRVTPALGARACARRHPDYRGLSLRKHPRLRSRGRSPARS